MIIHVTAEHIAKEERRSIRCPVDAAMREAGLPVLVYSDRFTDLRTGDSIPLPNKAKKFIRMFDAGHEVQPFTFELGGIEPETDTATWKGLYGERL